VVERTRTLEDTNRELRESNARAAHAARVRGMGDLAASFAHEVGNPAASLADHLSVLREALDEVQARVAVGTKEGNGALAALKGFEERIEESRQAADRIAGVVASLRRFGGGDGVRETISINGAVADAITLLEERIRACAELDLRLGSVPEIRGNALELSHVVLELLTNAVEGIERAGMQGTITVSTFTDEGRAMFMVQDTGCGIEPGLLSRIFEPFVSSKDGEPNAGLGLHCAYQTVERHGGKVRIRSKPGQGTTVTVDLPLAGAVPTTEPVS
jgi:two-component system NtrC family sensor kinase